MEVAKESWDYHKKKNNSFIVDLFQGQYKSRLKCLEDGEHESKTFDPYMYLSVPVPEIFEVPIIDTMAEQPVQYRVITKVKVALTRPHLN